MDNQFKVNSSNRYIRNMPAVALAKAGRRLHYWTVPHEGNNYHPHAVRHKTLATYSALLIIVKVVVLFSLFGLYPSQAEYSTITVNRIIELTNNERQELGLPDLNHNSTLDLAAQRKAKHMLASDYFAHTAPDGTKPWHWFKQVDYNYTYAGENLAMNFVEAEDAIQAWMDSPTHRDNIISANYEDIGIAVVIGTIEGKETTLVVQLFGKTYTQVAGEAFAPTSPPIESESVAGPINVVEQAARQEVKLETKSQSGFIGKFVNFSEKFFFILLAFIIFNLILTIIVRVEVQHKPVIMHCFLVVLIALTMIIMKLHFIENVSRAVSII